KHSRSEFGDDFDFSHDVPVHRGEVFCRNPQFLMDRTTYSLHRVASKKFASHGKSGHEARATGFNVPILRDLAGIFFIEHRIEDRLLRQPWWKFPEAPGC